MYTHTDDGHELDLFCDLQGMDDTGLPWGFRHSSSHPERIYEGAWITVGTPEVWAVGRVIDIVTEDSGEIVHVQPQPGRGTKWLHLLPAAVAS